MRRAFVVVVGLLTATTGAAAASPAELCEQARNDDTLRSYEPSLRAGFVRAFKKLFPQAKGSPPDAILKVQASFRCMDGRLYACFTGANLPCGKLETSRENAGATDFCHDNANSEVVPMAATGHDTPYSYRCVGTKAEIIGSNLDLDARGFAKQLWAPMD